MFVAGFAVRALMDDDGDGGGGTVAAVATLGSPIVAEAQGPDVDDDPARGPEDAPVLIIEFSDFECPFCGRFYTETLPLIMENYGDQIRFVYRDFPLTQIHASAQKAAEAAQCAFDQDSFWEYHDLLFENQGALDDASLKGYADQLGLDGEEFADCLDSGRYAQEVQGDYRDGLAAGVEGTPTFFINGQRVRGAQPWQVFQATIEAALAQAGQ
jgi:protein-disulfide isomerase